MEALVALFQTSGDIYPWVLKPRGSLNLCTSSSVCYGFLRFISGAKPANLLAASMVAEEL